MMVQMLGVFAEFERATMIDRVVAGMERKAARGGWNGGLLPFGYRRDPTAGGLGLDLEQAPLVARIFDLYLNKRMGARAIAAWLNHCGHRTNYGKPWSYRTVLIVLRNRTYLGEISFRGVSHSASHPALIDGDTFDAVQHLLQERGEDLGKRRANGSDYLLSGVIRCAHCGRRFVGAAAHGRSGRYTYYTCYSRHRYGSSTCAAESLPADRLERAVITSLLDTFGDHALIERAIAEAHKRWLEAEPSNQKELKRLESEIRKREASIDRYFSAFETGAMSEKVCAPRVEALTEQLAQLRTRQAELGAASDAAGPGGVSASQMQELRGQVDEILSHGQLLQRKALLQELVAEIRVESRESITPIFRVPQSTVRLLNGVVGRRGLEPRTSALSARRSTS